jgi:hypothetical protein
VDVNDYSYILTFKGGKDKGAFNINNMKCEIFTQFFYNFCQKTVFNLVEIL